MEGPRHILVVSGMTERCRKAIEYGAFLARRCDADLAVLHLVNKNPFELSGGELPLDTIEHDYEPYQIEAKKLLDRLVAEETAKGLRVKEFVRFGNPVAEIVRIVDQESIDLIVLLTRAEGRVEHYVLGRGKDALIRKLPCSVLFVKESAEPEREIGPA